MRKGIKIALWSLAGMVVVLGSAAAGFCEGIGVGARAITAIADNNRVYDDLSEVRSSMVALEKSDLDLSQRQLAIHLRAALFDLGALSKNEPYVRCTDGDRRSLIEAASYIASHPAPRLFGADPFLSGGIKFCESKQHGSETLGASR
jgi:hypothetical protein